MSSFLEGLSNDLTPCDTIPFVSTVISAPLRAAIGIVQIAAGAIFATISSAEYLLSRNDRFWCAAQQNVREMHNGWNNIRTACIAAIPYAGNRILAERYSKVVLERDWQGFYTIPPHAKIPGIAIGKYGIVRSPEFLIKQGDSIFLDTKAGIIPPGWEIKK